MAELIQGWAEYQRKLNALESAVRTELLTEAALAGGQIVLDAARAGAPRDTGAMAAGMGMRARKTATVNAALVVVGWLQKHFYGRFAERGTAKQTATPFLGPALESNRERIFKVMRETIIRGIQKVVR